MTFRKRLLLCCAVAVGGGCVTTQPFTQSLRDQGYGPAELAAAPFLTEGEFELWTALEHIGVPPRTPATLVAAPDDTTLVVSVAARPLLTLQLTFVRAHGRTGGYTLRRVNDQPLDKTITIDGVAYDYHPCYLNVNWQCSAPLRPGTGNDTGLTLLVRLPKTPHSRPPG